MSKGPASSQYTSSPYEPYSPQSAYPPTSPYKQQSALPPQSNEMVTLPPPQAHLQQELHRPYNPYEMYAQNPQQQMPYPPQNQNSGQAPVNFNQPAPRQRTAIACRYCRRRKIRCHGFDSSPDGRCTNCMRFHQECIFTPVSSQAHAFVPAHTAYPHLRNTGRLQTGPDGRPLYNQGQPGPPIYGAHGQPLGPVGQHDPNYPPPPPQQGYGASPYPTSPYDDRGLPQDQRLSVGPRRSSGSGYEYPDPTQLAPVSPASSTASYHGAAYPPQAAQPYYPPQTLPERRTSPQSSYYSSRTSGSPHGSASSASGLPPFPAGLHPPQVLPPAFDAGRTPPPSGTTNGSRPGMSVKDMLGPGDGGQGTRSKEDSDMLKALSRRRM